MLTFYYAPGTCALASHLALEYAGAPHEAVRLDFRAQQQRSPEFLRVNPKGRVPALATERGVLTETPAILQYIAQSFPQAKLAPLDDAFLLAKMNEFNSYLCSTVHVNHAHRVRGYRWVEAEDEAAIAAMKKKVPQTMAESFTLIEEKMLQAPWVLGERFSTSDLYLTTLTRWLEGDGVDVKRFPRVADHLARMDAQPQVRKVLALHGAGAMFQPFDLSGQGAVVTGGNGGIGLGMARALLAAGANVAIWGSNPDKTERARASLAQECGDPGRVHAFACDVGEEAQVERAFAESVAALGRVDSCFANAGVSSKGTLLTEMTLEEFRRVQRVNVEGVFLTFRAAARHMAQHGQGGSLVATASTAAVEGAARNSHYGASKGAVTAMVRALAVELARHRIRVNSILPGWIATDMTERSVGNPKFAEAVLPRIPARRWGEGDDFGGIAVYLASKASSYATGEQFLIDGGYTKF